MAFADRSVKWKRFLHMTIESVNDLKYKDSNKNMQPVNKHVKKQVCAVLY